MGVYIGDKVALGDNVTILPNTCIMNNVKIGSGTFIHAMLQYTKIVWWEKTV